MRRLMRVCVFGAGSLGSALGGILAKGHEVHLVGRAAHMSAIQSAGLALTGSVQSSPRVYAHTKIDDVPPSDLLIITTKAYDTQSAVDCCRDWASPSTKVLTLQNGLRNLELVRAWKGQDAFGGTTSMGAALTVPGRVEVSGLGHTVIGGDMDPSGASEIADAIAGCGLPTEVKPDATGEIWAKGVVNACINPVTAVLRVPNGTLLESESVTEVMAGVCSECEEISAANGVVLPYENMFSKVVSVARDTARNRSSMLRDLELSRRTEIREINGAFMAYADSRGLRAPLNRALVAMVEALESRGLRKVNISTGSSSGM